MKTTLSFLFILTSCLCFSQSKYFPGYIVNNNNDTAFGLISYKDWDFNPSKIEFKKDSSSKDNEVLGVKDVKAFELTGIVTYERFSCDITMSPIDISELQVGPDDGKVNKEIFLRTIRITDSLKLFAYRDKIKERYFISWGNATIPDELIYRVYYKNKDGNDVIKEEIYKQQIIAIAEKPSISEKLKKRISYLAYDLKSIRTFLEEMAEPDTQASNIPKSKAKSNAKIGFYVAAGLSLFKHAEEYSDVRVKPGTTLAPNFGIGVDLLPNRYIRHDFLRFEIAYTYLHFKTSGQDSLFGYDRQFEQISRTWLSDYSVRYNYAFYQKNKVSLFAGGGLSYLIIFRQKILTTSKYYSNGVLTASQSSESNPVFAALEANFALGLKINNKYQVNFYSKWPFANRIGHSWFTVNIGYQF